MLAVHPGNNLSLHLDLKTFAIFMSAPGRENQIFIRADFFFLKKACRPLSHLNTTGKLVRYVLVENLSDGKQNC